MRIARIQQQVEEHLLELDAVAFHRRRALGKLEPHSHALALEPPMERADDVSRRSFRSIEPLVVGFLARAPRKRR